MAKEKWRLAYPGSDAIDEFRSKSAAYDFVGSLRQTYKLSLRPPSALHEPIPSPTVELTVQVDEGLGFGWEAYEHVDFAVEEQS